MKRFFTFLCALTVLFSANAAPIKRAASLSTKEVKVMKMIGEKKAPRGAVAIPSVRKVAKAKAEGEEGLTSGTYYTTGGTFKVNGSNGWEDYTSAMPSVEVTVDGENVSIAGLAYFFKSAAVTGTLEGNTITIPNGQLVGTDDYGDEFLVGSNDGSTVSDIIFVFDPESKTLTAQTMLICESAASDAPQVYSYWQNAVFGATEPEAPEVVVLPEGAEVVDYIMAFKDRDGVAQVASAKVAVVDDQVYIQGIGHYLPEAWVVGTKEENTVTFAANQLLGEFGSYGESYAFYNGKAQFTFDPEDESYTASSVIFGVLGGKYYDGYYADLVLTKLPAADFDNPVEIAITSLEYDYQSTYDELFCTFSNVTADTLFVFDLYPAGGARSLADGTYTLADFDPSVDYSYASIAGVTSALDSVLVVKTTDSETGIVEFDVLVVDAMHAVYHFTFVKEPDAGDVVWVAAEQGFENKEKLTEEELGDGVIGVFDKGDGSNDPAYYTIGEAARLYAGNTLTIKSEKHMAMIIITLATEDNNGALADNKMLLSCDLPTFTREENIATWEGISKEVQFYVPSGSGNQGRIQKIQIFYRDFESTLITPPAEMETSIYRFDGTSGSNSVTWFTQVGFVGKSVYIQGLSSDEVLPSAWVYGDLAEDGTVTFPECYLGVWTYLWYQFDVNFSGAEMTYDAEADQFTCAGYQTVTISDGDELESYSNVTLTKLTVAPATPADPTIESFSPSGTYPAVKYTIPLEDTEGNELVPQYLSYVVFYKDAAREEHPYVLDPADYESLEESMTEIPYMFTDNWDIYNDVLYLYGDDLTEWTNVGIQTIYRVNGEENRSNVVWFFEEIAPVINTCVANYVGPDMVILEIDATDNVTAPENLIFRVLNGEEVLVDNVTLDNGKLTIDGLTMNTEYTLTVIAIDEAGNESNPATVIFTTSDVVDDEAPVWVSAELQEVADKWATIAVSATDNETPAENIVYVVTFEDLSSVELAAVNGIITLEGLTPETEYRIQIQAKDLAGNLSDPLDEPISFTTDALRPIELNIASVEARYYSNFSSTGKLNWYLHFLEDVNNFANFDCYANREEANAISGIYTSGAESNYIAINSDTKVKYQGVQITATSAEVTLEFVSYDEESGFATYNASFEMIAEDGNTYVGRINAVQVKTHDGTNNIDMIGEIGGEQGIEDIVAEGQAVKVIRNNQVLILKGDKVYNVFGTVVK